MTDLPVTPDLDEFLELARERRVISVYTRLLADDLTAVGLYHRLCGDRDRISNWRCDWLWCWHRSWN